MDLNELLKLSWRALLANKLRSFLTTLGIVIGVFAIILLVSIASGLQTYITNQIQGFGSNLIFIIPGRLGGARTPGGVMVNKLLIQDSQNLSVKLKNVADIAPVIQQITTAKYQNKDDEETSILGTTANYTKTVKNAVVEHGRYFSQSQELSGAKVAVIGQTVKNNLFELEEPVGKRFFIGNNIYTVIGVLKKRGAIFGIDQDNTVIIPLSSAKRQFGVNQVNAIYISANNESQIPFIKDQISSVLLKRLTKDEFTIQTAESSLEIVTNVTNILSLALGGIAAISLLIGGIGIANTMFASVLERKKEIGIMKSIGARNRDILSIFVIESALLGLAGGIIGAVIGLGLAFLVSGIASSSLGISLMITISWSLVGGAILFSLTLGLLFGLLPAFQASKLSPVEALRK